MDYPSINDNMDISELMQMDKESMMETYHSLSEEKRAKIDKQALELISPLFSICKRSDDNKVKKIYDCSMEWKKKMGR